MPGGTAEMAEVGLIANCKQDGVRDYGAPRVVRASER